MRQKKTSHHNDSGFTLIEVIIAIVILTIGILSVNAMQISSIQGNSSANLLTESSGWAQDRVEQIVGMKYDDLVDVNGNGTNKDNNRDGLDDSGNDFGLNDDTEASADGPPVGGPPATEGHYTIVWNVAQDVPLPHTKTIRIIVSYNNRGILKSVPLTYIKADII